MDKIYLITSILVFLQPRISCESDRLSLLRTRRIQSLSVTYPPNNNVSPGEEQLPSATSSQPTLQWKADPSALYTVIMIDRDAPSTRNPYLRDYIHWMVVNVSGSNVTSGNVIASYVGPQPREGTGLHRYYLWVYKQSKALVLSKIDERAKFNTRNFAKQYGLGKAIAGNFMRVRYEG